MLKDLDVMLVPVGGFFTIDAAQAAELVRDVAPKHVIPMHFSDTAAGMGYDVIAPVSRFTELMSSVKEMNGSVLDTESAIEEQVIVLKPKAASKK